MELKALLHPLEAAMEPQLSTLSPSHNAAPVSKDLLDPQDSQETMARTER